MNLNFLSAMSPLAALVLLVFLFAIAVVVALWSLLTLGSSPRGVATTRLKREREKNEFVQPVRPNRFIRRQPETTPEDTDLASELPTNHVSQSRVRMLKTLEPDPELEVPQLKPTVYDQMVGRQRVPKTTLPKTGLPKVEPLNTGLPKRVQEDGSSGRGVPNLPPLRTVLPQPPVIAQPQTVRSPVPNKPPLSTTEDTSTQPALFETGKRRTPPLQTPQSQVTPQHQAAPQRQPQPSIQRQESEAAFRASQGSKTSGNKEEENPPKPKTQGEKDDAFEKFLRQHDDLGF
jgi:hypothetical protein